VSAVKLLKKGHLGVGRQVYVLCAIGYELHQTTGSHCLYFTDLKKFGGIGGIREDPGIFVGDRGLKPRLHYVLT
jgi:hypothetical protein